MSKKYVIRTPKDEAGSWIAQVVRNRTSSGSKVERTLNGFATQEEAFVWATEQLASYIEQRKARAARRKLNRLPRLNAKKERSKVVRNYSFRELVDRYDSEFDCKREFKSRSDLLYTEVAFRMLKQGYSDDEAFAESSKRVGLKIKERLEKAKSGLLDTVDFGVSQMALANAQLLMKIGQSISAENASFDYSRLNEDEDWDE